MISKPKLEQRPERPYAGVHLQVSLESIGRDAPPVIGEIFGWLGSKGIAPAGAPFFRYNTIDMNRALDIEVGIPVAAPITGDGRVQAGTLPAGRWATLVNTGPYDDLQEANFALIAWGQENGLTWAMDGDRWRGRTEVYDTNPQEEPDPQKWETFISILAAD